MPKELKKPYITTIHQKNADGSFTPYPIGAMGENVLLKNGSNVEKTINDIVLTMDKGNILMEATLLADEWTGQEAPYQQTVEVEGMSDRSALLVSLMDKGTTSEEQETYNQNFARIAHGYAETDDGQVTFWVYEKPTEDIRVGVVVGSMPVPEDVTMWRVSDDGKHVELKDKTLTLRGGAEPTTGDDLATVKFVQTVGSNYVKKTGDTISGSLEVAGENVNIKVSNENGKNATILFDTLQFNNGESSAKIKSMNTGIVIDTATHVTGSFTDIEATTDGKINFKRNTNPDGESAVIAARSIVQNSTGDLEIRSGSSGESYGQLKVGNPFADEDAVTKKYAEDNFLGNTGLQTLTGGPLLISVNGVGSPVLELDKDTFGIHLSVNEDGVLDLGKKANSSSVRLRGVEDPTAPNEAVNKRYFDNQFNAYVIIPGQHIYEGRDLSVRGYTWADFKRMSLTGDYKDIIIGDYMTITVGTEEVQPQIAGIDCYYNTTGAEIHGEYDTTLLAPVPHHIDWISKDCLQTLYPWNPTHSNNAGNKQGDDDGTDVPWLNSQIYSTLDGIFSQLPQELQNVIINKNFLLERRGHKTGEAELSTSSGWHWYPMGRLWLPSEFEVFGTNVWSQPGFGSGQAMQYPLFANSWKHRIKGRGKDGSRYNWWLCSVASGASATVCFVSDTGHAYAHGAAYSFGVPLCFRTAATSHL